MFIVFLTHLEQKQPKSGILPQNTKVCVNSTTKVFFCFFIIDREFNDTVTSDEQVPQNRRYDWALWKNTSFISTKEVLQ